jgi:hypothetical protein
VKDHQPGFACLAFTTFALLAGCEAAGPTALIPEPNSPPVNQAGPRQMGTLHGRVAWVGELPCVPPLQVRGNPLAPSTHARRARFANPNAPRIDPESRGIADAFVFVERSPDPESAWPHPPVRVELRERQFQIIQGERRGRAGLVRRGDLVEFRSHDPLYHSVRLRGASFLSITLPDADQPVRVRLDHPGIVELTSGAGHYWMRAYLLVSDTAACAVTDAQGKFTLPEVPTGERELTCWLPNRGIARQERDPETGVVTRLEFQPGWRATRACAVRAGATVGVDFAIGPSPQNVNAW